MVQFISPDVGRRLTKVMSGAQKKSFRSAVGEWRKRKLESQRDYEVEINREKYFVGDLATESHFRREMTTESKIHIETKVLFLTAVAMVAKGEQLVITTGLPIKQHTDKIKCQLSELLCGTHIVSVNNATPKKINIVDIGIVAEGVGLYWNEILSDQGTIHNQWLATRPVVRILEIGSKTINLCTMIYISDEKGKRRLHLDIESDTLDYGYMALEAAGIPSDRSLEDFSRRIVADASKIWLTYNPLTDVVLLGGGGILTLGSWVKKHYPISLIARDPLFGNASGFGKMGMVRWQNAQKNRNLR